jgi:hypothetical protein
LGKAPAFSQTKYAAHSNSVEPRVQYSAALSPGAASAVIITELFPDYRTTTGKNTEKGSGTLTLKLMPFREETRLKNSNGFIPVSMNHRSGACV